MDKRSKPLIWLDAIERNLLCRAASGWLPLYIVTEYPKSGGTWFSQMLSEVLNVPFPRNRRILYRSCVAHGHYLYSPAFRNVVCVMRDGRDVMVSYYYHCLFHNERTSPHVVQRTRKDLDLADCDDVVAHLPKFIEYTFARQSQSSSPFQFTWPAFVNSWIGRGASIVKYEDLLSRPVASLRTAVSQLTGREMPPSRLEPIVEKYSFVNQAARKPGDEDKHSFLRKGTAGDWRNKFSRHTRQLFDELAGAELIELGYETDRSWVDAATKTEPLQA